MRSVWKQHVLPAEHEWQWFSAAVCCEQPLWITHRLHETFTRTFTHSHTCLLPPCNQNRLNSSLNHISFCLSFTTLLLFTPSAFFAQQGWNATLQSIGNAKIHQFIQTHSWVMILKQCIGNTLWAKTPSYTVQLMFYCAHKVGSKSNITFKIEVFFHLNLEIHKVLGFKTNEEFDSKTR